MRDISARRAVGPPGFGRRTTGVNRASVGVFSRQAGEDTTSAVSTKQPHGSLPNPEKWPSTEDADADRGKEHEDQGEKDSNGLDYLIPVPNLYSMKGSHDG
jgi:hypothetical protein